MVLWTKIKIWIQNILDITDKTEYTACEILFGIGLNYKKYTKADEMENLIIVIAKWYINKTRVENNLPDFRQFLGILKSKLETYGKILGDSQNIEGVDSELKAQLQKILRNM